MDERNKRVVMNFINTGMELDSLCASFPKFDRGEIEKLYNEHHGKNHGDSDVSISINCS